MAKPLLIIGNKNYSSWSLRPYMALRQADIPFDEKMIRFGDGFATKVKRYSKAARVPILVHNGLTIWDSLAILEYIAETWPEKNLWPKNMSARAMARSMCAEMHAGFGALRSACPMNLRRPPKPVPMNDAIRNDVARIEYLWSEARRKHGKSGPYLFGKFSIADAMFAPIASRFETFAIPTSRRAKSYMQTILQSDAFQSWKRASESESWIVPEDEVD